MYPASGMGQAEMQPMWDDTPWSELQATSNISKPETYSIWKVQWNRVWQLRERIETCNKQKSYKF